MLPLLVFILAVRIRVVLVGIIAAVAMVAVLLFIGRVFRWSVAAAAAAVFCDRLG